jgi:hypothetical protein
VAGREPHALPEPSQLFKTRSRHNHVNHPKILSHTCCPPADPPAPPPPPAPGPDSALASRPTSSAASRNRSYAVGAGMKSYTHAMGQGIMLTSHRQHSNRNCWCSIIQKVEKHSNLPPPPPPPPPLPLPLPLPPLPPRIILKPWRQSSTGSAGRKTQEEYPQPSVLRGGRGSKHALPNHLTE